MEILAAFFWDPIREMFYVPFLGRPVMWYGFFFVAGLMMGYFLMIPVFKRKLAQTKILLERDVTNWSVLVHGLKHAEKHQVGKQSDIVRGFSQELKEQLKNQSIPVSLKLRLLEEMNALSLDREEWIQLFPKAFHQLRDLAQYLADVLLWFLLGGILIGARLGHVFFYEWPRFSAHPLDIIKIWEGGLASHGGTIGIIIAVMAFLRSMRRSFPELDFVGMLDMLSVPTGLAAYFIRIGNFVNQEIIGMPTNLPWAVIFGHPADGSPAVPRHPTQLYEAFSYLGAFTVLYILWYKKSDVLRQGVISGLFFILVFGLRFLIEFTKVPLSSMIDESFLQTGQYLSIPFILLGVWLITTAKPNFTLALSSPKK